MNAMQVYYLWCNTLGLTLSNEFYLTILWQYRHLLKVRLFLTQAYWSMLFEGERI